MLYSLDAELFHWVNHDLSNPFFDWIMPVLRDRKTWIPFYVFLVGYLLFAYRKAGVFMVLCTILTVGTSDFVSNYGFKKTFKRLRPCKTEMAVPVIKRVSCGSGYSFTSNHAANHFAMATILSLLFGYKRKWMVYGFYTWAFSIAFAQVYVGLHYPFDVFGGAWLGILIGFLYFVLYRRWFLKNQTAVPGV